MAAGVCEVAGYSASVSERDENQCSVPFLSSVWSRAPALNAAHIQDGSPFLVNPIQLPHRHAQSLSPRRFWTY